MATVAPTSVPLPRQLRPLHRHRKPQRRRLCRTMLQRWTQRWRVGTRTVSSRTQTTSSTRLVNEIVSAVVADVNRQPSAATTAVTTTAAIDAPATATKLARDLNNINGMLLDLGETPGTKRDGDGRFVDVDVVASFVILQAKHASLMAEQLEAHREASAAVVAEMRLRSSWPTVSRNSQNRQ
eukprot:2887433-Prymnesium_polylepis.2